MRLTTRIALGLTLLTGLMIGVLAYQLRTVNELQVINEELSLTNVEAARISIRLVRWIEGVREFSKKALVDADEPGWAEGWQDWEDAVTEDLQRIRELELGPRERQALREVELGWQRYLFELAPLRANEAERPAGDALLVVLERIDVLMDELGAGIEAVIEANQDEVAQQAASSRAAGERAREVAWFSAASAGLLGVLICLILYLSISGPLRRLTRGTREIAEGHFEHRLPGRGRDELAALARDFNEMAAQLGELEEMKRDFVSHVSHELKGPLAAIHETILVLLERIPGPLNEKQAQLLTLSRQSANRLSGMISNLLEISRIEGGALQLDPIWVAITPLLQDVRDEMTPLATERSLELEVRVDDGAEQMHVAADPERLREVVSNLVANAIKFSPREEKIIISTRETDTPPAEMPPRHRRAVGREGGPFVMIRVEDRGPGIPEEHREGVFEKFYQVKRGARVQGQGVGLGLAICRNIVAAHGGAIWVDEADGGGACLTALLPRLPHGLREQVPAPPAAARDADSGVPTTSSDAGGIRSHDPTPLRTRRERVATASAARDVGSETDDRGGGSDE